MGLKDYLACKVAQYRRYLAAENEKAVMMRKQEQQQSIKMQYGYYYNNNAELLMQAINNVSAPLDLIGVNNRTSIMSADWVKAKAGRIVFLYHCWRKDTCAVNPAVLQYELQRELDSLCNFFGLRPVHIAVRFTPNHGVDIAMEV